ETVTPKRMRTTQRKRSAT
nr:Chain D, AtBMI1b binding site [Arabidopsis thaliana]5Y53_F Chain F, AtBMI1b binding site [Arabidopsis thaliana]